VSADSVKKLTKCHVLTPKTYVGQKIQVSLKTNAVHRLLAIKLATLKRKGMSGAFAHQQQLIVNKQ